MDGISHRVLDRKKPSGFELVGPLRYMPYMKLVIHAMYHMRGERGARLTLPPDYNKPGRGLFTLVISKGRVSVIQNFTKVQKWIDADKVLRSRMLLISTSLRTSANRGQC